MPFAAIAAAAAGDVERHCHQIAHVQKFNITALLDHFACDLVPQHQSSRRRRPAANHVLIAAANVGGDDLQDHAVIDLLARRVLQFRVINGLDLDFAGPQIHYASITCHKNLLFDFLVKLERV